MYCPKCGKEIEPDSTFCKHCGAQVAGTPEVSFHLNAHRMVKCVGVGMVVLAAIVMIFTFISYYRKPKAAAESAPPAVQEKDAQEKILELSNSVLLVNVYDREGNLAKSGSGFIAFDDETLVTNFHVIKDAYSIEIVDNTDYKYSVEGVEAYSVFEDIAILRIGSPTGLPVLELGDSDLTEVGDTITAIGSPLGLKNTVSKGIVSAIRENRDMKELQISVPISHGSSGGALFDESGRVMGVTSSGYDGGGDLNFAVPINTVKNIYGASIKNSEMIREATGGPGEEMPIVMSLEQVNNGLSIINEANYDYVESYLLVKGKIMLEHAKERTGSLFDSFSSFYEHLDAQGQYYGPRPYEVISRDEYVDVVIIRDKGETERANAYYETHPKDFSQASAITDNVMIVKVHSDYSAKEVKEKWEVYRKNFQSANGFDDFSQAEIKNMGVVGNYVYFIECNPENEEYYMSLVEYLTQ